MVCIGKICTHYKKGDRYKVLDVVKHSETQEDMVLYEAKYGSGQIWVRPLSMWHDIIPKEKRTEFGQDVRFELEK